MPSFFKPVYESTGAADKLVDRGFTENLVNAYSWQYSPIVGKAEEFVLFNDAEYDTSYNPLDDIEGFELYASEFAKAKNKEHTQFIKDRIRKSEKVRADLANLDWYAPSQLIAGILDPLNVAFAIPFFGQAGAATKVALTARQAFAKGAGGGFLAGAAGEITRAPFDPVATKQESLSILTASTILGGALASAPAVYRNVKPVAEKSVEKLKTTMTDKGDWIKNKYEDITLKFDEAEPTVTPTATEGKVAPEVAPAKPSKKPVYHKIQSGVDLKGKLIGDIEDLDALDDSVSDILDSVAGKNNATERAAMRDLKAIQEEKKRRASIIPEKEAITVSKDGTVFQINSEAVKRDFQKKVWTNEKHPKYAVGVSREEFQTAIEYQDFLIHQQKVIKERPPRDPFVPEEDYMLPINKEAVRRTHTGYGQKKTLATNSIWYNAITTPAKRILGNPKAPEKAKRYHQYINGNGAMAIDRNVGGRGVQSIIQRDPVYYVKGQQLLEEIGQLVDKERNVKSKDLMGLRAETFGFNSREEAIQEKFKAYLLASEKWGTKDRFKGMSDIDKEIFQKLDDFFNWFDDQGADVGMWRKQGDLLKEREHLLELIAEHEPTMKDIEAKTKGRGMTEKQAAYYNKLKQIVDKSKKSLAELSELIEAGIEDIGFYFPRAWNRELLINDNAARNKLRKILIEYIEKYKDDFRKIYDKEVEQLAPRSVDPEKIASGIIRTIMYGPSKEDDIFSALIDDVIDPAKTVGSKFSKRRLLNKLPDWQIAEFLRTDVSIIDHYSKTIGRKIEWRKKFGRRSIDDVLNEIELEAHKEGKMTEPEIAAMRRDFLADYEFSMGLHIRSPDRWDNVAVKAIKDVASMTYLHGAGLASVTDIGVVAFEHGIGKLIKPLLEKDSRSAMAMAASEVKKIVKGTDFAMSSARERFFSDNIHRLEQNAVEKYLNPITNAFYTIPIIGNNLGIVTRYLKIIEGVLRQDKLVNLALDIANNKAGADIEYWARYGLDINDAKKIASYKDKFVIEEDFTFANTENWPRLTQEDEDLLFKWNTAMNSGVGNTIMHATAMDKPIISRGVVYVRYHDWMKNVPFFDKLKVDKQASTSNYKYARIESGAMTMPFQFMDFTLAASNRITASMLDPARKNRLVGAMSLFGMAYLSLQVRKPDWWFENKGTGEIIARTLDYSGLFGVYSDIGYTMLHMATGLGAIDGDNNFLRGKYKPETATEAWLEPLGAGPGLISEYLFMANDFLSGDTTEAAERFRYNMPWRNMMAPIHDFFFKD